MADRDAWENLRRFSIIVLVVILIVWIVYAATGGPSTPGPRPEGDTVQVPPPKS